MNKKLSGAQLVLVPIQRIGQNKFPFVENIAKRYVKYIDFCPATYLPDTEEAGVSSSANMYITIADQYAATTLIDNLPLERMDYSNTLGIRQAIGSKISLSDCYVNCQNPAMVGKVAAFMVYYDLEEFSRRNMVDDTVIDNVSIPITTAIRYSQFSDSDRMTGKRFRRILVSQNTTTPDYHTTLDADKLQNVYLTLKKGSYNVVENMPLSLLVQIKMLEKTEWANIIFDFQSSYLTVGGAGTIPNVETDYVGKYVFINLEYEK